MKAYIFIGLILSAIFSGSCNKSKQDDFNGDGRIGGRLTYYNPYTGELITRQLGKKQVHIAYHPSDTLNFIYSAMTNDAGYFQFANLDTKKTYDLFFTDSIGGIKYTAFLTRTADNDTLRLIATPDMTQQNGIALVTNDAAGNKLQGVTVTAYDNYGIYAADSIAGTTSTGSGVHTFTSNQYGNDVWFNIAQGNYFFIARKQSGTFLLTGYSNYVVVPASGIMPITISLSSPQNTVNIHVNDIVPTPVSNASVYLYTSYVVSQADTANYTSSTYTFPTAATGIGTNTTYIVPGTYYISVVKNVSSSVKLRGHGIIIVPATGRVDTTITIQ